MILFIDIDLVQQYFRKADTSFRHIILNEKNFAWIKSQNFKKIFVVSNKKGTTPRQYNWLLGSLMDLMSGSGDKGTPVVLVQNYFNNYAD